MTKRIDLTQFEGLTTPWDFHAKYLHIESAKVAVKLIAELKRCYEKLDKADEVMLTAREVLMKHHEWMSMNDATSEEDDQEILDVVKALREASE